MSGRNRRTLAPMGLLMAAALTMLAAAVYPFLGEKGIDATRREPRPYGPARMHRQP
jgi:hypothetical protein